MFSRIRFSPLEKKSLVQVAVVFLVGLLLFVGLEIWLHYWRSVRKAARPFVPEIALLMPFSPPNGGAAQAIETAVAKEAEDIQKQEGVKVRIVPYDTHGMAWGAASAAFKAVRREETIAIVGPLNTRSAVAAATVSAPYHVVVVSPAASASTFPLMEGLYHVPPVDPVQGNALAYFLDSQGVDKVALVEDHSPYVESIKSNFYQSADHRGLKVSLIVSPTNPSSPKLPPDWESRVKKSKAQAIVVLGTSKLLKEVCLGLGSMKDLLVVSTDAAYSSDLLPISCNVPVYITSTLVDPGALRNVPGADKVLHGQYHLFVVESVQAVRWVAETLNSASLPKRETLWKKLRLTGQQNHDIGLTGTVYVYNIPKNAKSLDDFKMIDMVPVAR